MGKRTLFRQKLTETDITILLAKHLLGKLSPGKSFLTVSNLKGGKECKYGYEKFTDFAPTGIGLFNSISHNCKYFDKFVKFIKISSHAKTNELFS